MIKPEHLNATSVMTAAAAKNITKSYQKRIDALNSFLEQTGRSIEEKARDGKSQLKISLETPVVCDEIEFISDFFVKIKGYKVDLLEKSMTLEWSLE